MVSSAVAIPATMAAVARTSVSVCMTLPPNKWAGYDPGSDAARKRPACPCVRNDTVRSGLPESSPERATAGAPIDGGAGSGLAGACGLAIVVP